MKSKTLFLVPKAVQTTAQLDAHLGESNRKLNVEPAAKPAAKPAADFIPDLPDKEFDAWLKQTIADMPVMRTFLENAITGGLLSADWRRFA